MRSLLVFALCCVVAAAGLPAGWAAEAARRPNILFILADDLGCAQVGTYGNGYYRTPQLDRLAREGMLFTRAYASSPVCSPTRAALFTGRHPAGTHVTNFVPGNAYPYAALTQPDWQRFLPLGETTLAERLQAAGYVTALFGKWHLARGYFPPESVAEGPDRQGFAETLVTHKPTDETDPERDPHNVEAITARALRFLDEHRADPFFLVLSHNAVHAPIMAPRARVAKYPPGGDGRPENVPVMAAMMEMLDEGIGRVLRRVDELGLRENTLVIFYSDNGGLDRSAAQTPYRGGKAQLYEGGIRVPLIVRWPGVVAPRSACAVPVTTTDFLPTLLAAADAPPARDAATGDGINLLPAWRGESLPARPLYWHFPHYHPAGVGPGGALLEGDWKLITSFEPGAAVELYDLGRDPAERNNVAAREPAVVARLQAKLADWRGRVGAQMPVANPNYDPARASLMDAPGAGH